MRELCLKVIFWKFFKCFVDNSRGAEMNQKVLLIVAGSIDTKKRYVAEKVSRYLKWVGYGTALFHSGILSSKAVGNALSNGYRTVDLRDGQMVSGAVPDAAYWLQASKDNEIAVCSEFADRVNLKDVRQLIGSEVHLLLVDLLNDSKARLKETFLNLEYGDIFKGSTSTEVVRIITLLNQTLQRYPHFGSATRKSSEYESEGISYVRLTHAPPKGRIHEGMSMDNGCRSLETRMIVQFIMHLNLEPSRTFLSWHELGKKGSTEGRVERYAERVSKSVGDGPLAIYSGMEPWSISLLRSMAKKTTRISHHNTREDGTFLLGALNDSCRRQDFTGLTAEEISSQLLDNRELTRELVSRRLNTDAMSRSQVAEILIESNEAVFPERFRYRSSLSLPEAEGDLIGRLRSVVMTLEESVEDKLVIADKKIIAALLQYFVSHCPSDYPRQALISLVPSNVAEFVLKVVPA